MPEATIVLLQPLELDLGVSFARFQPSLPTQAGSAAKTESSNAVVSTLRYHQRWGSEHDQQRAGAQRNVFRSRRHPNCSKPIRYITRHLAKARYRFRHVHNTVEVGFLAGEITGHAPLYERFVLGNSTTLRGWSKFDLDPLGGSHVVHGSIDYRYRFFQAFYDTGAIWDRPQDRVHRSSPSAPGLRWRPSSSPWRSRCVRAGRTEPIFYAGLNF